MNTWQPIETAPKDGSDIDLWVEYKDRGARVPNCGWYEGAWRHNFGRLMMPATHWMPLPDPPELKP